MEPEERSTMPSRKSGQSKSLQRLTTKSTQEKLSENPKKLTIKNQPDVRSHKNLKNPRFDTPEKNPSPKPRRELPKNKIYPSVPILKVNTPFPPNISLVPKQQICSLIKNGQGNKKFNPMLLTPVLLCRKGKDDNKSQPASRAQSPNDMKTLEDLPRKDFHLELYPQKLEKNSSSEEKSEKLAESGDCDKNQLYSYNNFTQSSIGGEEEEPVFLSERISNDCESNQSLKFDFDKHKETFGLNSDFFDSIKSSSINEPERLDTETQTEEHIIETMLKCLDNNEVKLGIKFISQIARFVKTLN
ncbi:hypothetical protein SteCoe_22215 [Stentor coeruleus]|uniref:Uncharacterized protein n=1 Tax=Stentor coeruleus TaxID=5963 RepID=A0A1R2BMK7_9CILI|nr:hypothetical protein SteCoe_22215 [Stentor coeruleus]